MKALTLSLSIIAILGSAASGYFWFEVGNQKKTLQGQLAGEQARATTLQEDLTRSNTELETTKTRLAAENAEHGDTKSRLTAAEARNIQIQRDLDQTRRNLTSKEETERRLNADLDTLRRELVQARLSNQVGGSSEEVDRLRQTIAALEARLAGQTSVSVAPATNSTGEITGGSSSTSSTPAGDSEVIRPAVSTRTANAEVARVGPRNAFVVLNLTAADGIAVGNRFNVLRDGAVIATATISEIQDTFAVAQVAPASIKSALAAGDTAALVN